jgi:hypothetical protein
MIRSISFVAALSLLAACSTIEDADFGDGFMALGNTAALTQTSFPSAEDPGPPFYARINPAPPFVFDNGTYAAIVFYRDPADIPASFDLLSFFDVPGAFFAAINVTGTNYWNGAAFVGSPRMSQSRVHGAVPVWFVSAGAVHAKIAEGLGLTISDLEALDPIKGMAAHFREVLHPHPAPPEAGSGGHPVPKINLTARGLLEDGRRFDLGINATDRVRTVRIRFR